MDRTGSESGSELPGINLDPQESVYVTLKIQNNTNTKHYLTIQYDSCVVAQAPFQIQTAPTKFSFIYKTALAKSFFLYKRHIKYKPVQSPEYNIVENAHPA